ncbi:MAG: hypothetical protein ABEK02_03025 [Haloquadratum sp.]
MSRSRVRETLVSAIASLSGVSGVLFGSYLAYAALFGDALSLFGEQMLGYLDGPLGVVVGVFTVIQSVWYLLTVP